MEIQWHLKELKTFPPIMWKQNLLPLRRSCRCLKKKIYCSLEEAAVAKEEATAAQKKLPLPKRRSYCRSEEAAVA
ncbi:CLUMA_CG011415, isoform A [Clunio marinus]|uniref:CLUMA_CG011415, isoform A n=1 Tax=Clunio marinus TaxID=568069 RepID=A0A1J1IG78_9DIPT|nr:CLUMA_CG011415, isoform A [Clunio marinus]